MKELPSKEDLQKLQEEKGHEAIVWYAWRNALRAMPMLGFQPFNKIWQKDTLKHLYSICRIYTLLAQFHNKIDNTYFNSETSNYAYDYAYTYAEALDDAYAYASAYVSASAFHASASYVEDYAYFKAYAGANTYANAYAYAYSEASDNAYISASAEAEAYARTYDSTHESAFTEAYNSAYANAYSDYQFLQQTQQSATKYWFSQPLWQNKLDHIEQRFTQFIAQLNHEGLTTLANDLQNLWQVDSQPIKSYWQNYAKQPSEEVFQNAESLNEFILHGTKITAVRVILLGPGGAGKTSLADRLRGEIEEKKHDATSGIDYLHHQALNLSNKTGAFENLDIPKDLQLFLWDFGGQTLFHGLHQSFLHENCVYILVIDSRREQAPDPWLQQIRHLANIGKLPPVFLIMNEYEKCERKANKSYLKKLYGGELYFHSLRCNDSNDSRLNDFKQKLLTIAKKSQRAINQRLLEVAEQLKADFSNDPVLERLDLEDEISDSFQDVDTTLNQLEGLGYIVFSSSGSNKNYCLNPTWVIDHAYNALYLPCFDEKGQTNDITFKRRLRAASKEVANKNPNLTILNARFC